MSQKRPDGSYEVSRRVQREFGMRLQEVRRRKSGLQKILAGQLGLSRTSISNIERGTHRVFLDQVYAAAHALGVEVMELLPPVSEVYTPPEIHTVSDDPLSDMTAARAMEVARTIQDGFVKRTVRDKRIMAAKGRKTNA